ncbi:MAG TPA: TetR/AcrR family transcriptional regulator [Candidatus Dormibacteraeota bacterium]|nr:TetR/AcrR family transcriptional regulator [Candidatus Dormibacteraeota bacterium]
MQTLPSGGQRLRRAQRREQILAAATDAFARAGFAGTSLDDLAAEAGISRVILYRHFASKADLYRAVLDRARRRLLAAVGEDHYTLASVDALVAAAAADPAGFRLLFRHAAREPEFREEMDRFRSSVVEVAYRHLAGTIPDGSWAAWAAQLAPTVAVEAIIAWLDAGQPDREGAGARIQEVLAAVARAARAGAGA